MNPNESQTPAPQPTASPLNAMRPGEVTIFAVKRHIIGLIGIYASFIVLLLIAGIAAFMAPNVLTDYDQGTVTMVSAAVFLVAAALCLLFVVVAHYVYYGNRWVLTSDSLTQVYQRSLFDKQSSQLSLANLEDITVIQNGIMSHLFNYGTLKAETAGERSKFVFIYCPNPNVFAQKILVAREEFEQGQWYGEQRNDHSQTPPAATTITQS